MFHVMFRGSRIIRWYWKVIPSNELTQPLTPDPENPGQYLKNPDQYFAGIRGLAATRNEAQALVNANVANLLENGVAGITALENGVAGAGITAL